MAAFHLARLVHCCTDREPSPNVKIVINLCSILCSDSEFTPQIVSCSILVPFNINVKFFINRYENLEGSQYFKNGCFQNYVHWQVGVRVHDDIRHA